MLVIKGKEVFTTLEELVEPKHTALLLIDLQNGYTMSGGVIDKRGQNRSALLQIIPPVKRVLEAARSSGVLVVHVQMTRYADLWTESPASLRAFLLHSDYKSGDPSDKLPTHSTLGTWAWQIADELTPLPTEIVVRKHRPSAFIGTDMNQILRSNSIKTVAIVGAVTEGCVMATAKDAQLFDYYPVILQDCIASGHQARHDAAFFLLSEDMDVADSEEVLKIWASKPFARQ